MNIKLKNISFQWRGEDINLLKYIDIHYTAVLKEVGKYSLAILANIAVVKIAWQQVNILEVIYCIKFI